MHDDIIFRKKILYINYNVKFIFNKICLLVMRMCIYMCMIVKREIGICNIIFCFKSNIIKLNRFEAVFYDYFLAMNTPRMGAG